MANRMYQLSYTQIDWLVMALRHHIAEAKQEMDAAPDDSPTQALGEIFVEGREKLAQTLLDALHSKAKTIYIK